MNHKSWDEEGAENEEFLPWSFVCEDTIEEWEEEEEWEDDEASHAARWAHVCCWLHG